MNQPYIGNTKINKLYKGSELWCNWSSGGSEPIEPSNKPIMDGLVCWLDGRDYVNGSTVWNDRSRIGNHGTLSNSNGVLSNGGVLFKGQVLVNNVTKNLTNFTIFIHYKIKTSNFWSGVFGNSSDVTGASIVNFNLALIGLYGKDLLEAKNYKTNDEKMISIIVLCVENEWRFYTNNITNPLTKKTITPSTANYMNLCCRKPNTTVDTDTTFTNDEENEWYSFKFYNRALTEDEIKHNLNYEEENGRNLYFSYNTVMGDEPIIEEPGEMTDVPIEGPGEMS